ncbi:MAG: hypothetical protein Q8K40_07060 [Ignavibacteria bacterium]|nr:hypothetical protein [Ignavibacteria bacterium]
MSSIFVYFGYAAGIVFFLIGVIMLSGLVFPEDIPAQLKYVMGFTLVLYGIYRVTSTYFKKKQDARLSERNNETTKSNVLP